MFLFPMGACGRVVGADGDSTCIWDVGALPLPEGVCGCV